MFRNLPAPTAWARFCVAFVAAGSLAALAVVVVTITIDPYDTGRLALVRWPGVPELLGPEAPRLASASRARDPAFDAAVLGSSHAQLLKPDPR
jgi:hypothetical protein